MVQTCAHCGKPVHQSKGAINRALRLGKPLYCDRICAGLARRREISKAEKVERKRLYDAKRRIELAAKIKAAKAEYHKRTYDPTKAARTRKENMARHVAYCQRPEYKKWKKRYDQEYRAKRLFGPFWESAVLLAHLDEEVVSRMTRYEIMLANGTLNKAQSRRRGHERTVGYRP